MKPHVTLLMISSLDGRLHPSRWTASPDGDRTKWGDLYEEVQESFGAEGWIVGRVTMAEMSKAGPHEPDAPGAVARPVHVARRNADSYAIAVDPSGRLHFSGGDVAGGHVVVLLGREVSDAHLAELVTDGISYVVSETAEINLADMLETLNREFGIARLMLEGGGLVNGRFLAAGMVDEASILIAPALDADDDVRGIVAYPGGLAGKCELSLAAVTTLKHGIVHLRYIVRAPDGPRG